MSSLKNKNIIVTGGSGLIGHALIADIKSNGGNPINFDLKNTKKDELFFNVDITDQKSVRKALEKVANKIGKIDGLVNNAYPRTEDWGIDFEDDENLSSWKKNVDLQLNSYIGCCQEILKFMKKNSQGSIVNISSIYGVVGNDFSLYKDTDLKTAAPYSAIKGGLINFTRYFASKYGVENIRMNCISPGGIFDHQNKVFVKRYEEKVPMKRMGKPEDIAPAVSFLLSDGAQYITGQNIIVDGGWTSI